MKDFMQKMVENAEKARFIRVGFSPMSERTMCTSVKYPDCLDCALGSALGCVHFVKSQKFRIDVNTKQKVSEK